MLVKEYDGIGGRFLRFAVVMRRTPSLPTCSMFLEALERTVILLLYSGLFLMPMRVWLYLLCIKVGVNIIKSNNVIGIAGPYFDKRGRYVTGSM